MTAFLCADDPAAALVAARRSGGSLPTFPIPVPTTLADAYAFQRRLCAGLEKPVVGWKVGRIPPSLIEELGVERLAGPILSSAHLDGAPGDARIFRQGAGAIEAEVMLRIGEVPDRIPATDGELRAVICDIRAGFEVASSPVVDVHSHAPFGIIADVGINNGILLGPCVAEDGFETLEVETRVDGLLLGRGRACDILDGPWGSLRFILDLHFRGTIGLAAGQWISAGAITGVHPFAIGQRAIATFGANLAIECVASPEPGCTP